TGPLLDPGNSLGWINQSPGQVTLQESQEVGGDADLSTLQGRQKEAGLPIDGFRDEVLVLALELDRLLDDCYRGFQEGRGCLNQLVMRDGTVPIFSKLLQHMPHASLSADDCIPGNPKPLRQAIRRLETNAMDIQGQAIGILLDAGNSLVAVSLVDTDRT